MTQATVLAGVGVEHFLIGAAAMYSVYWVQERSLFAGYVWAAILALSVTWFDMMQVLYGEPVVVKFVAAVTGLAGIAFVAWGWEPVFEKGSSAGSRGSRIEIESTGD